MAASVEHTIAMKRDGSLWAWGYNGRGILGDGTITTYDGWGDYGWINGVNNNRNIPTRVRLPAGWVAASVSAGFWHTASVGRDGTLLVWGSEVWSHPCRVMQ